MPSTLPTHPLAVLPLKLWRPRWFDGVALATGACAPDFAYALDGAGVTIRSHTVLGALWWGLPTALAVARLIRLGAPAVAAHLPGWLREYGVLGRVRPAWWISVSSALLGVASHLLWDLVTHPGPVAAWWPIRQACDDASLILMPLFLWYCGSRHLLTRWHGAAPPMRRRPRLFWAVSAAVCALGFLVTLLLVRQLGFQGPHVVGVRLITSVTVGLLGGAVALQLDGAARDRPSGVAPVHRG